MKAPPIQLAESGVSCYSLKTMVVRMRHTRAHTANRRSHHALKNMRMSVTKEGTTHPRHKVLLDGSTYRGRSVMDVTAKRMVRAQKSQKRREQDEGPSEKRTEEKSEKPEKAEKKEKKIEKKKESK